MAASAGLVLDPWQQFALEDALGERADGQWAAFETALIVPRQNGKGSVLEARVLAGLYLLGERLIIWSAHEFKALDVETPILTSAGWSTMGALVDGDEVFAPDGQPTKVVAAHPWRSGRPCFRLTFDDGQEVVADAEHPWEVTDTADGSRRVLTTQQMLEAGVSTTVPRAGRDRRTYRFRVDIPEPLVGQETDLPVDPWLLGAWLGDGTSAAGSLTVGAQDLEYVLGRLDQLGEAVTVRPDRRWPDRVFNVTVLGLRTRLRKLGVLGDKRIPTDYLLASEPQRRELLAGVMDTDGGVSGHQISVTMIKRDLMEQVASLVRSLGYKASLKTFRSSLNGQDAGPMYRVSMTASQAVSPFGLPRKSAQVKERQPGTTRAHYNVITAIESVPTRPTRCITVAHESSMYLVGHGFVPTHNTAQEGFIRTLALIDGSDDLRRRVRKVRTSHGEEGVELMNGQRLRFMARTGGSGRGFSSDCLILDEAFHLSSNAVGAMLPTLSARPNPQVWYASSAGKPDSDHLRSVRRRALEGGSPGLAYLDWSAEQDADLDDRQAWAQANPGLGIRITEEHIARERAAMDDLEFARERLGIWPNDAGVRVIEANDWNRLRDEQSEPVEPVELSLEVTWERDAAALSVAGFTDEGRVHVETISHDVGVDWAVPAAVAVARRQGLSHITLDMGSPAASLAPAFEAAGLPVRAMTTADATAAFGMFFDLISAKTLVHRGQPILDEAVALGRKRPVGERFAWDRRQGDVTALISASNAAWSLSQPAEAAQPETGVFFFNDLDD